MKSSIILHGLPEAISSAKIIDEIYNNLSRDICEY